MSLTDYMYRQGKQPFGLPGKIIGKLMNRSHDKVYQWALNELDMDSYEHILDIGCGGGSAINLMANYNLSVCIDGIDHSAEMVKLATKFNSAVDNPGRIKIQEASVEQLPFAANSYDLVTAFETIQFWPDYDKCLDEVKRVLRENGEFLIVNRCPPEDSPWSEKLKIKNKDQYTDLLTKQGFSDIKISDGKDIWIKVLCEM